MTFTTDINDLIRLGCGDVARLRNIRDTIKHDNFITTVDKKYVESLISTYLRNQSIIDSEIQPKPRTNLETRTELKPTHKNTITTSSLFGGSNNKKLGIFAGVAAAIVLVVVIGFSASTMNQTESIGASNIQQSSTQQIMIKLDESSYKNADIISVTGNVKSTSKELIKLYIENINGEIIWKENVNTKNNGNFSTLLIAAGNGWGNNGIYTLNVQHDTSEKKIEFNFSL